ncbi:XkdX family protein [Lactobacillus gasseri]|uniref:XkdX family protein n=1 Tax=Lactobacillus gasseri TaxID=1596 RepID=UPI000DEB6EED|nr:XkdX family protein [Lactobacillus gasseri]RBQ00474.1 XkdX family protein [Lactobacillus gasseri]
MFDTILDNLTTIQTEMIEMFKQQYEWGWFGDDKATSNAVLQGYVRTNALTPEGYKEITGEDYETSVSQS